MLPQFGFPEFLLIAITALIVVGPKDLPLMMRRLGKFVGRAKAMAREFQSAFDDIARQAELDELRKEIQDLKTQNTVFDAEEEMRSFEEDMNSKVMEMEKTAKEDGE
ncbi:MAG: Sec-independent protein translocase protein TatB [Pseudomonadota bacterium]